jgi:hypothetical protein
MGYLLGLGGNQNTGKSFSRSFLTEQAVVITCNTKSIYLKKPDGSPVDPLEMKASKHTSPEETLKAWNLTHPVELAAALVNNSLANKPSPSIDVRGNFVVVENILQAEVWLKFVSLFMPQIKVVIVPDFTHFITDTLTDDFFRARGKTSEYYERYVDLAADTFKTFFKSARSTRRDLIQVIEFHLQFDETSRKYKIFTPGGKMLSEKFLPDSYFDIFLCSYFVEEDEDKTAKYADRFKFITRKHDHYDARSNVHDPETELYVPNNLQDVIDRIRKFERI